MWKNKLPGNVLILYKDSHPDHALKKYIRGCTDNDNYTIKFDYRDPFAHGQIKENDPKITFFDKPDLQLAQHVGGGLVCFFELDFLLLQLNLAVFEHLQGYFHYCICIFRI